MHYISFFLIGITYLSLQELLALAWEAVKHGVALIFPFVVLRKFSGGYHAKNLHTCILGSGFLLFLCIMLSMHVQCDLKLAIATVIASVSLITFSPIDSENRRLDTNEKRTYKKTTVFFVILFGLLDIALFLLGKYICWDITNSRLTSTLYRKENV